MCQTNAAEAEKHLIGIFEQTGCLFVNYLCIEFALHVQTRLLCVCLFVCVLVSLTSLEPMISSLPNRVGAWALGNGGCGLNTCQVKQFNAYNIRAILNLPCVVETLLYEINMVLDHCVRALIFCRWVQMSK